MATFNPSAAADSSGGGEHRSEVDTSIPSDDYLIRMAYFKRRTSGNGNEYLSILCEVISGQYAGKAFWSKLMCAATMAPAMAKWRSICRALDITESFELNGSQGDADFVRLFRSLPFKARINRKEENSYVNHDIDMAFKKDQWTENDIEAVKKLAEAELGMGKEESGPPEIADDIPF